MARGAGGGAEPNGHPEVRSLAKGLEILSLFQAAKPVWTVDAIAREIGLPVSSAYRLVATLRQRGYVRKAASGPGYTIDHRMLRFGEIVRASSSLHRRAHPHLESLAAASAETAVLVVRSGDRGVVVDKVDSAQMMKVIPEPGLSFPLHASAAGKVLLAAMKPAERQLHLDHDLDRLTDRTQTDPSAVELELRQVQLQGYALADEELMLGARSLAAPIHDPFGGVAGCLAIAGPSGRVTLSRARELAPMVIDHCRAITAELADVDH